MTMLLPDTDDPFIAAFFAHTANGELRIQACSACGRLRHPPRSVCPWCRAFDSEWRAVSGAGTVWSFVIAHPPLLPAYAERAPYNVAVVAIDDDPRIRLIGNVVAANDALAIGMAVRVGFPPPIDGVVLPHWVPA